MPITILVVDDIEANRAILRRRLQRKGFAVIEAANGAEAVALTQEWRPDVILMDLSMPVMDGIEAWRMICELIDDPPAAIALTAVTIQDVRLACDEIGFRAFLTKPVDFRLLLATIEKVAPPHAPLARASA
jgi:CheY-like chemotaxis protein